MRRIFATDKHLVHDPTTGLTHRSPRPAVGRVCFAEPDVATWPHVPPAEAGRAMPLSVCWSPIVRCNLHCPHCLDDTSVPELSPADRARIAGVLADAGLLGVDISGGEPLLVKDLPVLARRIASNGHTVVSVTTNGWHLTRRAEELADAVDAIRVSLDGPDAASHDRVRGAGSFPRACAGIIAAAAAGIPVQVQTVLMAGSCTTAQPMVDLAASLGAGGVTFLQMLPIGAGAGLRHEMLIDQRAADLVDRLHVPEGLRIRLRARSAADGFTVVRADGRIWRNCDTAQRIERLHLLRHPGDLTLTEKDGSA